MRDYHMKDGFTIPAGTLIGVPSQAMTMDASLLSGPETFDGFRFSRRQEEEPLTKEEVAKLQWTAANLENLSFGYGRCACPGRTFANHLIKMVTICLVSRYDMKLRPGENRPQSAEIDIHIVPNQEARVLMRRRIQSEI